jgi:outer membrane PBP1 activator LpoA protein
MYWLACLSATSLLMLQGCASNPSQPNRAESQGAVANAVQDPKDEWLAEAERAIEAQEFVNAHRLLQQLRQGSLSKAQQTEWLILAGQLSLGTGDIEATESYLYQLSQRAKTSTPEQRIKIRLLAADLYESKGEYFAAAGTRVFAAPDLSGSLSDATSMVYQNHQAIWRTLQQMPRQALISKALEHKGTELGQWVALSAISQSQTTSIDEQLAAVKQWQLAYPAHPAARVLPGSLAFLQTLAIERPSKIALLLPLSGPLARSGKAIRDGFLASHFHALNQGQSTPDIRVYDSEVPQGIELAYAEALMDQVDWIVGPVGKDAVTQLEQELSLLLPTLALNYGESEFDGFERIPPTNLFQFGLSPEDEAIQIAELAWNNGHKRALVMVPEGPWGERIYHRFYEHWTALGGEIGEVKFYPAANDYNPHIRNLLNVDESAARAKEIRRLVGLPIEFEPRRRKDSDWLFMVAQPQQARQIKPTLAFNFASDLPVYATSHVYTGHQDENHDRDLNGVRFCDLPWVLDPDELYQSVEQATPNGQGPYLRLYAMGVDAYRVLPRLLQLKAFPYSRLQGATGKLSLEQDQRVKRQTECTQFRNGRPVAL